MNEPSTSHRGPDNLRADAARRVHQPRTDTLEMSAQEVARLVYELEIHREELEIQNEELRRAQLELKNSRDRYVDLYDFAPVGYLTLTSTGEIAEANLTSCEMLCRERSRLIGMRLGVLCDRNSKPKLQAHLDEVFATQDLCSTELRLETDRQLDIRLDSRRSVSASDDEYHCRTVMTDVSARRQAERAAIEKDALLQVEVNERHRAEARLREQQKQLTHIARVSTMGEMVAGIAHEINQPLHAIATFATACELKVLQAGTDPSDELPRMLQKITDQAVRSGEIIKRLRAFVGKAEITRSRVSIRDVVNESVQLTAPEAREHKVTIRLAVDNDLRDVFADRIQIQQVLVNLMKNAYEATESVDGPRTVTIRAFSVDDTIDVAVEDTGKGLSLEIADRVFEAFRSTKADGMGLGLAISRSIIEAHGGRIWVAPNSERGTVFHFTLPVAAMD